MLKLGGEPVGVLSSPTRAEIKTFIEDLHCRAGLPHCCDPRDLVERAIGYAPCPARISVPTIVGRRLLYPDHLTSSQRGPGILRLTAQLVKPSWPTTDIVRELILPESTAAKSCFDELSLVQPHAPIDIVQGIFMRYRASGVFPSPLRLRPPQ